MVSQGGVAMILLQQAIEPTMTDAATDTVARPDSIVEKALHSALVVERPTGGRPGGERPDFTGAASWVMLLIIALFCFLCMKYSAGFVYFRSLIRQVVSSRVRENLFDDTVRETLFIIILNLLGAVAGGMLLYYASPCATTSSASSGTAGCILAACVYALLMPVVYIVCGTVFADFRSATIWARGAIAGGALLGPALTLAAVPALFNPAWRSGLVIFGIVALILVKLAFISKSFRIFFSNFSSWLLFLYYLCIVEAIPLILTCAWGWHFCCA